jgi:pectate lyase
MEDNRGPNKTNATSDFIQMYLLKIDTKSLAGNTTEEKIVSAKQKLFINRPISAPTVTTVAVDSVENYVLERVGAIKPRRDSVDSRIVSEVRTRAGRIINSSDDVGGYPKVTTISRPPNFDTDQDGMPNSWEIQNGFNPDNSTDGNEDKNGDGYTNVENYLHSLL